MIEPEEFLSDEDEWHAIALGVGIAIAVGGMWILKPADVISTLNGLIGLIVLGGAVLSIVLGERFQETVRKEPWYFVAGLAFGVVLAARFIL